jgi:ABC-type phosphate/phosphonate transport system substrate-binding protein
LKFKSSLRNFVIVCCCILYFPAPAFSAIIFSAPPREDPEKGKEIYGPLVKYLSKVLKEPVIYQHPGVWARYAKDMRSGKYDIVFDGPHFGAWRIKNIHHTPIVKLPGSLRFVILAKSTDLQLNSKRSLVGVKICGLASPNLGTMTVYNIFNNPVNMPQIQEVTGGFKAVYKALKQGKCRAAVVRDNLYYSLRKEEKRLLKVVVKSDPLPNQTITVSNRLRKKLKMITQSLMSPAGQRSAKNLLKRFSKKKKTFFVAKTKEYENLENLLTGIVWGW